MLPDHPIRRTIVRMLIIGWGSAAVALAVNAVRTDGGAQGNPRRLPLVTPPKAVISAETTITLEDAELMWQTGEATFLDARSEADYRDGHIALAFSLPESRFESVYPAVAAQLSLASPLIVYCDGAECELSHALAERLKRLGYENVQVLVNGWTVWREAGLPTTSGDQP